MYLLLSFASSVLQYLHLFILKVAAGTLDASTKIYAVRVDAVHADAYRVLGGLGAETKPGEGESLCIVVGFFFYMCCGLSFLAFSNTVLKLLNPPSCTIEHFLLFLNSLCIHRPWCNRGRWR